MKWFFSTILILLLCKQSISKEFESTYLIKTKGITIGSLTWALDMEEKNYFTSISLEQKGFLSSIYSFKGKYNSFGKRIGNQLFSQQYNQLWITKKKKKIVKIKYEENKIKNIFLDPPETELARFNFKKLKNYNDPITSFLNVVINKKPAFTIDGRRAYILSPTQNTKNIKVLVEEYKNIWTDHKRKDLEYIELYLKENQQLPNEIRIKFKGSIFLLKKN